MGYECKQAPKYKLEAPHKLYPQKVDEIRVRQYKIEEKYRLRESHYREGPTGKISQEEWQLGYLVHDTFIWFTGAQSLSPSTPN